jgi:hypothetical protein
LLSGRQVQVLITASAADADVVSGFAESHHLLFLNAASRSQALRNECRRHTFHVEATAAMYSSASRMSRAATQSLTALAPPDSVVLWGSSLQRFGASQINQRFQDKYHMEMDGPAWSGWVAVKIVSEATLRTHSTASTSLTAYFESASNQFDGHKGWPLSFRKTDHQLRQPLYVIAASGRVGRPGLKDVPELRGGALPAAPNDGSARSTDRMLDALVELPGERACNWGARK